MPTHRENFDSWFVNVLERLFRCRDAGFVILMTAFPLLERFLRQRAGLSAEDDNLTLKFYDELHNLFPELGNRDSTSDFWQVYRNGLLHQVTFSQKRAIDGSVSHDPQEIISINPANGNFCVHPVAFAKRILKEIGNDFSTFEGAASAAPGLPRIGPLGTSAPPRGPRGEDGSSSKPSGGLEDIQLR
jgi:hypothetical protein